MKQGNGSDLLNANDPRNTTIGIIYVEPTDDRESVLAAILTQEKLGRKHIAIELPNQNKAFQRPVDFDGLKNMRRKLQAQLVIIAAQGSGPADFARQRRFTYFTSLESYAKSLREEGEAVKGTRGGIWPFGGRHAKQAATAGVAGAGSLASDVETPISTDASPGNGQHPLNGSGQGQVEDEQHFPSESAASGLGPGLGANGPVADAAMRATGNNNQPSLYHGSDVDEDVAFAMPAPSTAFPDPAPHVAAPEDSSHGQEEDENALPPPSTRPGSDDNIVSPGIITFPVTARARNTKKLPVVQADIPDDELDDAAVAPVAPVGKRRQRSGKAAVVVAGAGAVATAAGTTGNVPPAGTFAGSGSGGPAGPPPQRNRRPGWQVLLLALVVLLVFSLLLCGGIAVAAPSTWQAFTNSFSHILPGISPAATVTITPKSVLLQNTYAITALTAGTPDSTKRQVEARQLTFTTQPQTKTVSATGFVNTPATHATGTLTFVNGSFAPYGVSANTVFTDAQGVQIVNNVLAYIPAANPNNGTFGRVTVPAHAITAGSRGNIRAFDFSNMICCANNAVAVSNTVAFSGGQDPQKFTAVQQSDIDNAAAPYKQPLLQSATTAIDGMKRANEQFVGTPKCTANVTSDHKAGDRATSVTVSVTAACSGVVYDQVGADNIATSLLKAESGKDTGGGYVLTGNVVTTVTQEIVNDKGAVVFVKAQGIWVAQINDARKAQLASLIAGKTQDQANTALLGQKDVVKVDSISLTSGNTLPTNASQITIVVQNVPGLQGTPTATATVGVVTPTPTNTLTSPVVRPSPGVTPGK